MKRTKKSKSQKPSFEPDVIEKDLCKLFSKEWLKQAAKITGLIKRTEGKQLVREIYT